MSPILVIFRLVAAEFYGKPDAVVEQWIDLTLPLVSRRRFGRLYNQAVALLTAHRIKLAELQEGDPLSDIGQINIGNLMRVASFSEGETSVSFNANRADLADKDAELALTQYGIQFLTLRRMSIMSISSAGESFVGGSL